MPLSLTEEFLIKEYESASKLTFHADGLRDKLSTFFLTFAGAAVTVVGLLLKGEFAKEVFGDKQLAASLFLIGVSAIGILIFFIHARLRRVQLEHFSIMSRIRVYCLEDNIALWNAIRLSPKTLPRIRLRNCSGSELWALTILLPTVTLLAGGIDLLLRWSGKLGWWHALPVGLAAFLVWGLWMLYVRLASEPVHSAITHEDIGKWRGELRPTKHVSHSTEA
jgi:hypothetical protein